MQNWSNPKFAYKLQQKSPWDTFEITTIEVHSDQFKHATMKVIEQHVSLKTLLPYTGIYKKKGLKKIHKDLKWMKVSYLLAYVSVRLSVKSLKHIKTYL